MNGLRLGPAGMAALAATGWLALAATALPGGSPLRVIVTFVFVLFCPGAATVWLAQAALRKVGGRSIDVLEAFVLAIVASLALGALVSEAFLLVQSFTTTRAILVLAVYTTVAVLFPVHGSRREHGTLSVSVGGEPCRRSRHSDGDR